MNNNFNDIKSVFIGGCPRSGTTMLGSILGSAPDCVVTPESHFKQTIPADLNVNWNEGIDRRDFLASLEKSFRFKLWKISLPLEKDMPHILKPADYRRAILSLASEYADKKNWRFWIDHTPQNIQNPLMLLKIFPKAKFIHIVRDPRAVASSVIPLFWGPDSAEEAAFWWAQKLFYGEVLEHAYPDRCLRIYYEDILTSPEKNIKEVCDFCGINFDNSMLSGSDFKSPKYTRNQHKLIGLKPEPSRLDSWKKNLDIWQIAEIEKIIGDIMELIGYNRFAIGKLPKRPFKKFLGKKASPFISFIKKKIFYFKKTFYDRF